MRNGMTGFGRAGGECGNAMVRVEMKSVNQRFLDVHLRLPEGYRHLDPECRQRLSAKMARGKVDVWLEVKPLAQNGNAVLNNEALALWLNQLTQSASADVLGAPTWQDVLALPDVLQTAEESVVADDEVLALFDAALCELNQTRSREGDAIEQLILARCTALENAAQDIRAKQPELRKLVEEKLRQAVEKLRIEVDGNRFEQELIYLLARGDVDEEIDRLLLHVQDLRRTLQQSGAVGRRIDFLLQEINRETNTLGTKSADSGISQQVVDMKVWIEQIREQVQNLE